MRIIAGEMRSRRLKAPEGMDTRPTADRVKEALFSILGSRVHGARVLDLYAGSGALALEALSRGAERAVLCDAGRDACRAIRENIQALGCEGRARLLQMRDTAALEALKKSGEKFDLIFLDPPYRMETAAVCEAIAGGLMEEGGCIVVEHSREKTLAPVPGLRITDRREYGVTALTFLERAKEEA